MIELNITMKKIILLLSLLVCGIAQAVPQGGSYVLFDYQESDYLVKFNNQEVRSIASITKLFTAITIINSGVDLNESIKVDGKSRGHVPVGVYMPRIDLLRAMIISSDNRAAETLANHHPGGFNKFLEDVNFYTTSHSLMNTHLVDSSGLLPGNVSTAFDLVEFLNQIKDNPVIRSIANERNAVLAVPKGKKTLKINLRNTNPELFVYDNILISKTGFTNPAGRCVAMLIEKNKELYALVVLGQKNVKNRSAVVRELIGVDLEKAVKPKIKGTVEYRTELPL